MMGGRGGTAHAATTRQSVDRSPVEGEDEFRRWLERQHQHPVFANMVDDPFVRNKVILNLPDRGAYIDRNSYNHPVVRDVTTDAVLFQGRSDPDLYRQMSKFYGVTVEYTNERTLVSKVYGSKGDPRTSPAAKKYGVS